MTPGKVPVLIVQVYIFHQNEHKLIRGLKFFIIYRIKPIKSRYNSQFCLIKFLPKEKITFIILRERYNNQTIVLEKYLD